MKIVVSGYVGKKITGIGRNLISLLNAIKSDTQYIIYTNYDMVNEFSFTNPNVYVKTYSISKNSSFKNLLWTTFVFPFKVLQEHANKALIPNFTLLLFKFRPTYVIMHDLIEFNVRDKFSKKKMFYRTKLADPITARRANYIITDSENSKKDIVKFLKVKKEKISVIYNGVNNNMFHRMNPDESKIILENKKLPLDFLLYAGTIDHPGKNAMSVIKAFEKLKSSKKYKGSLILAGMPGKGFEIVEDYIKKSKWREDIYLTGYVTDTELVALYSTRKVFCFLSLYEGFGIPPLEAMACGAVVVTSNTSSLPEVVGNVGITVNPYNIDDICLEINYAINYIDKDKYNKAVQEHLKKYDWNDLGKQFNDILVK